MADPAPQKYVRTYDTDREAIEAGKIGGFTETKPAPSESDELLASLKASVPPPPREAPIVLPTPVPRPAPSAITPLPQVQAPTAAEKEEASERVRTYQSDFSTEVKDTGATQATIVAAEQDTAAERAVPSLPSREPQSNFRFWLAGLGLVIIGIVGIGGAYWYVSSPTIVATAPAAPTRIFVDEQNSITGTGAPLMAAIAAQVATPPAEGAVRLLTLANATTSSVFSALSVPAPDVLLRNVESSGSLAGVIHAAGGASPFFILSVDSYSDTFAGMLAWEPSMQRNLGALYPLYQLAPQGPASTSTPAVPAAITAANTPVGFIDETVASHDVRALRDASRRTLLIYGYWDVHTLIIARNEDAYGAILDRLATSRTQQ